MLYARWVILNIEMVWINAGTYERGSSDSLDWSAQPPHEVTLTSGFFMGIYQVTQEQWSIVMYGNLNNISVNPSGFSSNPIAGDTQERRPVDRVNWYEVIVFCNRLSMMEGLTPAYRIPGFDNSDDPDEWGPVPRRWTDPSLRTIWDAVEVVPGSDGYRLPTEAQWEYACRAGTTTAYNTGDTITDDTGWYGVCCCEGGGTREVGLKPPNAWGLYDMHGNVWEWCWDWWSSYSSDPQIDPVGPLSGSIRVIRGGSWVDVEQYLRSAYRSSSYWPIYWNFDVGFRLVRP
jgi:formylglycine-generating enzyme required for sulfatase activity